MEGEVRTAPHSRASTHSLVAVLDLLYTALSFRIFSAPSFLFHPSLPHPLSEQRTHETRGGGVYAILYNPPRTDETHEVILEGGGGIFKCMVAHTADTVNPHGLSNQTPR